VGHSFGRLADEYDTTPPPCNSAIEPPEANAALEIGRDKIKWARWVDGATQLPTTTAQNGVPGAYSGARYCSSGLYRPTLNSKMRSLGRPFEQINAEQLVRRIYNLVSPIDSVSPSETALSSAAGSAVDFRVNTPRSTRPLRIRWTVDGTSAGEAESMRLNTGALPAGNHVVQVEVSDQTPLVRNDTSGLLAVRRSWTVAVPESGADDLGRALEELLKKWRNR
jgi:hypothetical protein